MRGKIVLMLVITVSVLGSCTTALLVWGGDKTRPLGDVMQVGVPAQSEAQVPEWAQTAPFEPADLGDNLALGAGTNDNGHVGPYVANNAADEDDQTYWEGTQNAYPNELTLDLGETKTVTRIRIVLNPDPIWAARTQEIAVMGSTDGETYASIKEPFQVEFDPASGGNQAIIDLEGAYTVQFVRLVFTANTQANAGQAAEVQIY